MNDAMLIRLTSCQLLTENELRELINKAIEILRDEPNVLNLSGPITVCGDIHGQFYDLMELFKVSGFPPRTNFLFLGDYVDRGLHSIEVITLLLALKVKFPTRVHLLRGNHESRQITQMYGFYDECIRKYGNVLVWRMLTDLFDYLPVSALINNEMFCLHGGLSPSFTTIDEIRQMDRLKEVPHVGMMCDLLWSDPDSKTGWGNSPRGAGFMFGPDITAKFNEKNGIKMICRAHQLAMEGYLWHHDKGCLTIFSAPNYCYRCGNLGTVLEVSEKGDQEFLVFEQAPKMENETKIPDYFI